MVEHRITALTAADLLSDKNMVSSIVIAALGRMPKGIRRPDGMWDYYRPLFDSTHVLEWQGIAFSE
jgi:hypothetical protein